MSMACLPLCWVPTDACSNQQKPDQCELGQMVIHSAFILAGSERMGAKWCDSVVVASVLLRSLLLLFAGV